MSIILIYHVGEFSGRKILCILQVVLGLETVQVYLIIFEPNCSVAGVIIQLPKKMVRGSNLGPAFEREIP